MSLLKNKDIFTHLVAVARISLMESTFQHNKVLVLEMSTRTLYIYADRYEPATRSR